MQFQSEFDFSAMNPLNYCSAHNYSIFSGVLDYVFRLARYVYPFDKLTTAVIPTYWQSFLFLLFQYRYHAKWHEELRLEISR